LENYLLSNNHTTKKGVMEHNRDSVGNGSGQYKSRGEYAIGSVLSARGIVHAYEQPLLVIDQGKHKIWHPDFTLPQLGMHIEYYGMAGNPEYDKGIRKKQKVYDQMGIQVLSIFPEDLRNNFPAYLVGQIYSVIQQRAEAILTGTGYVPHNHRCMKATRSNPRPQDQQPPKGPLERVLDYFN